MQGWTDVRTDVPGVYRRGPRYRVVYRLGTPRRLTRTFDTFEDAVAFKGSLPRRPRSQRETKAVEGFRSVIARDPCAYCGGPGETFDHIEPKATGGPDEIENLTSACRRCNSAKGRKSLLLYLAYTHGCWEWRAAS